MMEHVNILITGANRGIGKGILELYLQKPNHTVIAANRDPDHATSKALHNLPKGDGTTLLIIKMDLGLSTDPAKGVEQLSALNIGHLDILVANAAVGFKFPKIEEVEIQELQEHIEINVHGFLRLYKSFKPLLKKGQDPRWVTIGSSAAFLTRPQNWNSAPNSAYAPTKLLQHYYTRTIADEEPWLNAFPIDPGFVQTDLGNFAARLFNTKAPLTTEESTTGIVRVIDASTLETHSGRLWKFDGSREPW